MKENDIILNMLANPEFTVTDFQSVGLNGNNTGLRSEQEYLQSDKIRNNKFFADTATGEFDEAKFHSFYVGAGQFYNQLATQDYEQSAIDQALFSKDNMWVSPDKRVVDFSPKLVRQQNEHLVTSSLESIGKRGQRTLSQSEIAQTQKVYNTETGEWTDSPNDSFFDNFFNPLVLATYDEDEYDEQGNLIHEKGERKLNEEGLPYYETLGGRDIYGKQVLNKFNMITTDGSFANQFDFFDADDIEQKSIGGTIMRNAALVGSMFIPGVGPWITGLSVASQTAGLLATLGKVLVGNESETLNNIQGWAKSVNRSAQTEYAAENTWCVENFLNMIGDTVGQLKEQRWIFQSLPKALGHGKAAKALSGEKGYNEVVDDVAAQMSKKGSENTTKNLLKTLQKEGYTDTNLAELEVIAKNFAKQNRDKAINYVDDLIKQANNIGSPISKAYMTALTVQDTYGEARAAGASHLEAALLTVGYAAGEAKILNTELGQWILPELQGERLKYRAIANALSKEVKEAYGTLAQTGSKKGFMQKLVKLGSDIAHSNYAEATLTGAKTLNVLGAHALTEATEEVSEELLGDFSKSVFNAVRWLRGEDSLDLGEWDNMFDRYAMSAAGGFVGGGIASAGTNFKQVRDLASMDKTKAMNEILYMVNNGKETDFLKSLNAMNLGNKNLSASKIIQKTENGEVIYAEGTADDNQDKEIKTVVAGHVKLVKDILESEGAKVSTKSLLNKLTLDDQKDVMKSLRYTNLQNTRAMGLYLQDFHDIQSEIVKTKSELLNLNNSKPDSAEDTSTVEDKRSLLEAKLKELRVKKDAYINGQIAPEAIRDAIFEMNPVISNFLTKTNLKLYAEAELGKKWSAMSKKEQEDITKKYKEYSETSMKNDIHTGAAILQNMIELFSPFAKQAQDFAADIQKTQGQAYNRMQKHLEEVLSYRLPENVDSDEYLLQVQDKLQLLDVEFAGLMGRDFFSEEVKQKLSNIASDVTLDPNVRAKIYTNTVFDNLVDTLENNVQDFIKLKYIHPEVKNSVLKTLGTAQAALTTYVQNMDGSDPTSYVYDIENDPNIPFEDKFDAQMEKQAELFEKINKIDGIVEEIKKLSNTPIFDYLNQFQISSTNSDLKISKHLDKVTDLLNDAAQNSSLDEVLTDEEFQEDNEEALLLLDSFIAVVNSMKVDNADINNPTGYSKMLNEVYSKQGIKDYVQLTELDSSTADIMLQDALLIKKKLEFIQDIHNINKGQKLKQHDKVNTNKNYLLYNTLKNRFVNVLPDDWIGDEKGTNAKQVLQSVIDSSTELSKLTQDNLKIPKEIRNKIEDEITVLSNTIYDIFNLNKKGDTWDSKQLEKILSSFSEMNGFFQKTGGVLNDSTKNLDDNSFIWWLASKAILRQSDFDAAYVKSLSDELAPIPSQEMAVQLGVAAITNSNALNEFVNAYRNTVIKSFNNLKEDERTALLKQFDENSTGFANKLLKYFASYDAIPQYQNMVFIEGIPGSGKSGGVFKSIKAVVDQIDPELLKNAVYAHVKQKSAQDAGKKIGLENAQYYDKAGLMKWMSSEWRDVLENSENKDGKVYLYKDSYEFDSEGKLQNKWKVNKITNAPKVIFIDEVSHYNQQELSLIEQFAKLNGIVVLTAGDLDQDTLTTYFKDGSEELNVTINRNNFVRSPKLGLSLRSLNKQMTHDITMMQASMQNVKDGNSVDIQFTYLEDDPKHKGLFGVKTASGLDEDVKKTIQTMIDTATDKIGYIYNNKDSALYKYLESNFKDKITFYKDSEAQGLEGQYYIVENDINYKSTGDNDIYRRQRTNQYMRSLYTGISRAEQGVLAIVPNSQFGLLTSVSSVKDPTYQLESIGKDAIKKASKNRKEQLEALVAKYPGNPITVNPPTNISTNKPANKPVNSPTQKKQNNLPPLLPPSAPKVTKIDYGYLDEAEAQLVIDDFNIMLKKMAKPKAFNYNTKESFDIIGTEMLKGKASSGEVVYTPAVILTDINGDDTEVPIEQLLVEYGIKDDTSGSIAMIYNVGDKLVINEGGSKSEVIINNRTYVNDNDDPKYFISNLDGSNPREIFQSDLQASFVEYWTAPIVPTESIVPDNGLENDPEELAEAITSTNEEEEGNTTISRKHINHRIYTFNAFQPGIKLENGKIVYKGSFDKRIDNGIGLLKAWRYKLGTDDKTMYKRVEKTLGNIKQKLYHEKDNSQILDYLVNDVLRLPKNGNYSMLYAIKSSDIKESSGYEQYYSPEDDLDYIYSDAEHARDPQRKKLVLLLKDGDKTIFELNTGSLNSPLTLIQELDEQGNLVFAQTAGLFQELEYQGYSQSDALDEVISQLDGKVPDEQDLINLIKLYKFTSNGIFYLGKHNKAGEFKVSNFNLASCKSSGTQLIKERGEHQLNGGLQYNGGFISLEKFTQNPQFNVSSILSSKEHEGKVKAGYPFVLVSTNPDLVSDEDLIDAYVNDNTNVRMYYVLPPRATASEWLLSQHNNYEEIVKSGGTKTVKSLIGNQFTAYRILDALIKEGTFDQLDSNDGTKEQVKKTIEELNSIQEKWNKQDIEFSGNVILGEKTDQELYEEYLEIYQGTKNPEGEARHRLATIEQRNYLEKKNGWGTVPITPDVSIQDALSSYLRGIIWKSFPSKSEDLSKLAIIDQACKNQNFDQILYKTFIGSDIGPHGEFVKVITNTKYGIAGVNGKILDFEINAKIDPPSFSSDFLWEYISEITASKNKWNDASENGNVHRTKYFYYDPVSNTWKLTSSYSKKFENDYLSKQSVNSIPETVKSKIKSKYSKYFDNGVLDESIIDDNKDEITNLRNLASVYNRTQGHYGFEHNGRLYLTEYSDNVEIRNIPNTLQESLYGVDTNGNEYTFKIQTTTDDKNNITKLEVFKTTYSPYKPAPVNFGGIKDADVDELKTKISNHNKGKKKHMQIGSYLSQITNTAQLIDFAKQFRESFDGFVGYYNGEEVDLATLEGDSELLGKPEALEKVLKYINGEGVLEENNYNTIVKIGSDRMLLLNPSQAQRLTEDEYPTEMIEGREVINLSESDIQQMKSEQTECSPEIWNLK